LQNFLCKPTVVVMTTYEFLPRDLTPRKPALRKLALRKPTLRKPVVPAVDPWSRSHRRGRVVALAAGSFLLPWSVVLGMTLPASTFVPNWSLAWMGLDFAEAVAALLTAWLLGRGSPRASLPAMAGAGLLCADALFDVCTSTAGTPRMLAVGEAVLMELPLAAAAIWLAVTLTQKPQVPEAPGPGSPRP
jgi:hypothetical protein